METANEIKQVPKIVMLNGKEYGLNFDCMCLAYAEDVYGQVYGREVNVGRVIVDLLNGKLQAVMAFTYGALKCAKPELSWETFSKNIFTFENYNQLQPIVEKAIMYIMGSSKSGSNTKGNDEVKN